MRVTAEFEYNAAEHFRAMQAVQRLSPLRWILWATALLLLSLAGFSVWFTIHQGRSLGELFVNYLPYLVLLLLWGVLFRFMQRRTAKRLPENDRSLVGVQRRTFDAAGYHSEGNGVQVDIPWATFYRAVETDEFVLLFYNKRTAYYVPVHALSAEQLGAARGVLQDALPPERLVLRGTSA